MSFNKYKDYTLKVSNAFTRTEIKEMRKKGKSLKDIRKLSEKKVEEAEKAAIEKARADKEAAAHADTEISLLKDIKVLLENHSKSSM